MLAVKARYDGKKVILPKGVRKAPPGKVIIIFEDAPEPPAEIKAWEKAQETAFTKVWDNAEDAIYDSL